MSMANSDEIQIKIRQTKEGLNNLNESLKKLVGDRPFVNNTGLVRTGEKLFNSHGSNAAKSFNTRRQEVGHAGLGVARAKLFARLGGSNRNGDYQFNVHGGPHKLKDIGNNVDEDDVKHSSGVSSLVVKEVKSRDDTLKDQKTDKQGMARNKRMFGSLLGTLQKFRVEETKQKDREEKKDRILKKIEETEEKEKEEVKKIKQELFTEKRLKKQELKILELQMIKTKEHEECSKSLKHLEYFIKTKKEPKLFWLPKKHNSNTRSLLDETKKELKREFTARTEKLNDELQKIESEVKANFSTASQEDFAAKSELNENQENEEYSFNEQDDYLPDSLSSRIVKEESESPKRNVEETENNMRITRIVKERSASPTNNEAVSLNVYRKVCEVDDVKIKPERDIHKKSELDETRNRSPKHLDIDRHVSSKRKKQSSSDKEKGSVYDQKKTTEIDASQTEKHSMLPSEHNVVIKETSFLHSQIKSDLEIGKCNGDAKKLVEISESLRKEVCDIVPAKKHHSLKEKNRIFLNEKSDESQKITTGEHHFSENTTTSQIPSNEEKSLPGNSNVTEKKLMIEPNNSSVFQESGNHLKRKSQPVDSIDQNDKNVENKLDSVHKSATARKENVLFSLDSKTKDNILERESKRVPSFEKKKTYKTAESDDSETDEKKDGSKSISNSRQDFSKSVNKSISSDDSDTKERVRARKRLHRKQQHRERIRARKSSKSKKKRAKVETESSSSDSDDSDSDSSDDDKRKRSHDKRRKRKNSKDTKHRGTVKRSRKSFSSSSSSDSSSSDSSSSSEYDSSGSSS